MKQKLISFILAVVMIASMIPISVIPAAAAESVTYVDRTWDATNKKVVEKTETASAEPIESSTTAITLDGGWYYVDGNVEITAAITVAGTPTVPTCIILADGCKLTAGSGIRVNSGKALAIYAQTAGTGKLETEGSAGVAGIGGAAAKACGTITINGGTINATGGSSGATGIGGGKAGAGGTITINGGTITAVGTSAGSGAAGIGGSYSKEGGTVTINGGTVNATGGYGGAGIGCGCSCKSFTVTINGGTVTATGGYGDDVTCSNGGAGIGSGSLSQGTGSTVTITGGNVTAIGNHGGAGIGSGCYSDDDERTITITGGNITAAGANGGSGIGGGYYSNDTGSTVTITDGTVNATGADGGAGIGGGQYEEGGTIAITGGTVTATGGNKAAGIGGGDGCVSHGVLEADYDVMRAGDAAPGEDTALDDYLTARSTYAYIHTHKFDSYTDNGDGTHSRTCACEAKENVKIDHTFSEGVCTFCGAEEPVHEHDYTDSYVDNGDGTHSGKCECGEIDTVKVSHTYDGTGSCVCGATAHTHSKGTEYMTDGRAHWLACADEDCPLKTVVDYEIAFSSYYGEELKETLDYSEKCGSYSDETTSMLMGRQGFLADDAVGRTIIGLTQEQLEKIGNKLIIEGCDDSDDNNQVSVTVDCAYTYFYNVEDGEPVKVTAEEMGCAAFVIIDSDLVKDTITGFGYYRVYNDTVSDGTLIGEALYAAPRTFKAVLVDDCKLSFYFDAKDHSGDGKVFENTGLYNGNYWEYNVDSWKITGITIDPTVIKYKGLTSAANMFDDMFNAESISGAEYLDVTNVEDMSNMFSWFGSENESFNDVPDVGNWNTSKVNDMSGMFYGFGQSSSSLNVVPDVSNWNTSGVFTMEEMFCEFGAASEILNVVPDVSNWNTSGVYTMAEMFCEFGAASEILNVVPDVGNWITSGVTDMALIFFAYGNSSTELDKVPDVGSWNVSNVLDVRSAFDNFGLESCVLDFTLDLSGWDLSMAADVICMFYDAGSCAATWEVIIPAKTGEMDNTTGKWYTTDPGTYIEPCEGREFTLAD